MLHTFQFFPKILHFSPHIPHGGWGVAGVQHYLFLEIQQPENELTEHDTRRRSAAEDKIGFSLCLSTCEHANFYKYYKTFRCANHLKFVARYVKKYLPSGFLLLYGIDLFSFRNITEIKDWVVCAVIKRAKGQGCLATQKQSVQR